MFYEGDNAPYALLELLLRYDGMEINERAFDPMFVGSVWGKSSPYYNSTFTNPKNRASMYDWCNTEYGPCNFL
ncbi:MAG: hypothetical protein ACK559_13660, partial [bacterium]